MRCLFTFLILLGSSIGRLCAGEAQWTYGEFTIQGGGEGDETMHHALMEQIDIVRAVGLPRQISGFFQSVPLIVVPEESMPSGSPGLYMRKERLVKLTSRIKLVGHKPVLLHELLHAYHHQRIVEGFRNSEILTLYRDAKRKEIFSSKSHMMQNPGGVFRVCWHDVLVWGDSSRAVSSREFEKAVRIIPVFAEGVRANLRDI